MSSHLNRNQLVALKRALEAELNGCNGGKLKGQVEDRSLDTRGDIVDEAAETFDLQIRQAQEVRRAELCAQVTRVLKLMEEGKYTGLCETCEMKIPWERLVAYPSATKCVRCSNAASKPRGRGFFRR